MHAKLILIKFIYEKLIFIKYMHAILFLIRYMNKKILTYFKILQFSDAS